MEKQKTESPEEERSASLRWLYMLIAIVLTVQVGMWWLITTFKLAATPELGQFGDMFGAVNTLFSGLAFAGIIYTILLQRNELALQRVELSETREELKLSRLAHEKNSEILDQQLQILKVTSKIENAEYRKEMLPQFIANEISKKDETSERMSWFMGIQNVGREAKNVTIEGCIDPNIIKFQISRFPYIRSGYDSIWEIWSKKGLVDSHEVIIRFQSMDDQNWMISFRLYFDEGYLKTVSFQPAFEAGSI